VHKLRHALSGAIYELDDEGRVLVTRDGTSGTFTGDGVWIAGDLRTADAEMCRWIRSGSNPSPRLKTSRRYIALTSRPGSTS
jgi:hypothetical protein